MYQRSCQRWPLVSCGRRYYDVRRHHNTRSWVTGYHVPLEAGRYCRRSARYRRLTSTGMCCLSRPRADGWRQQHVLAGRSRWTDETPVCTLHARTTGLMEIAVVQRHLEYVYQRSVCLSVYSVTSFIFMLYFVYDFNNNINNRAQLITKWCH